MADQSEQNEVQEHDRAGSPPVDARWVGVFEAALPDGTTLVPGETVVQIPEAEAKASDNWEVVSGSSRPKTESKPEPEQTDEKPVADLTGKGKS